MFKHSKPTLIIAVVALYCSILASNMNLFAQVNFDYKTLLSLKRLSDPQISPDGNILLFNMDIPDLAANKKSKNVYLLSLETAKDNLLVDKIPTRLTQLTGSEFNHQWSADGKQIAFISTSSGVPQVFIMDYPNGTPRSVTAFAEGASGFNWSPKGKHLLVSSEVKIHKTTTDLYPAYPKSDAMIYDALPIRHWDHFEDDLRSHIFLVDLATTKAIDLMPNEPFDCPVQPMGGNSEFTFSPDGKEIAYTSRKVKEEHISTNSDIYIYDVANGTTKNITPNLPGYDKDPKYSRDGKYIAFKSQARAGLESDKIRIMIYEKASGKIWELTEKLDQWINDFVWSADGKKVYIVCSQMGIEPLAVIDFASKEVTFLTSDIADYASGLTIDKSGDKIVIGKTTIQDPVDFYFFDTKTNKITERITNINKEVIANLNKVQFQNINVPTKDGKKVQTWVIYPPNFDPMKKYPMITYCQGGPQSMISHYWSYRWNIYLMASQGYIVVAPNRRGAPGFGQEWVDEISKDWGGKAMQDILDATDEISKLKYVDTKRIAAVGASAGGYTTFWLAGNHQGRFSAFISHCGVFNLESMYGATEELFFANAEFGGPYWENKNKEIYEKNSPNRFVQNWDTPILIYTGMKDYRVPYNQSLEAFTAAQMKGIPSKIILFPNENHWVLSLQNAAVWQEEFFNFLDTHCKNKK